MNKIKVTIIVPVYNVEEYVEESVKSLMNQSLQEIEILCVNDGSSDSSLNILRRLEQMDDRISVISKENTGYGDTVNIGIELAKGEYIGILESDDFSSVNMFETLYNVAIKNNADVVKSNYYLYFTEDHRTEFQNNLWAVPYGRVLAEDEQEKLFFSASSVWSAIYKREFLQKNRIIFSKTPGASYQDVAFAFKVLLRAKRIVAIKDALVFYRQDNPDSSSNSSSKIFCVYNETKEILSYMLKTNNENKLPVYVKCKYIWYSWHLNRLVGQAKRQFLIKMFHELRQDCFNGYLLKKYWNDSEWEEVHRLIFDFESFYGEIFGDTAVKSLNEVNKKVLIFMLRQAAPLFIYGAGKQSGRLIQLLRLYDICPDGVVVTSMSNNPESLEGIPVMDIEYVSKNKRDVLIISGVAEKYKSEIIAALEERYMGGNYLSVEHKIWNLL